MNLAGIRFSLSFCQVWLWWQLLVVRFACPSRRCRGTVRTILPVRYGGAFAQCGHTPEQAPEVGLAANYPYHARLEVGFSLFVAVSTHTHTTHAFRYRGRATRVRVRF